MCKAIDNKNMNKCGQRNATFVMQNMEDKLSDISGQPYSFEHSTNQLDSSIDSASWSDSNCTASTCSSSDLSNMEVDDIRTQQTTGKKKKRRSRGRRRRSKNGVKKGNIAPKKRCAEPDNISEEEKRKYVGLDCEMVDVRGVSTLARVSIVDWYGETVFNTFVRIEEEVTDYLTFVSGIRKADIESEDAMSFDDCQDAVLEIISGKVIVGHALRNDFTALNIIHPWYLVRDTAKYEPFMKSHPLDKDTLVPRKLKVLAKNKLDMIIQEDGKEHDSIEDATAAMELYKKARAKWENAVQWKVRKTNAIEKMRKCVC